MAIGHLDRSEGAPASPFLAADVGGTHARVAMLRASRDAGCEVEVLAYRKFVCADFPGLAELLNTHLVFATDVAEAADALVQLASVARLSSGVEATVELPAVAIERLRVLEARADAVLQQHVERPLRPGAVAAVCEVQRP